MGKELVISSTRHETKVAMLEDDQLVEVFFQRANEYSLAGSIHKGRVTRVLPGMQSAFVDLGLDRDAFLYVSDFFEEHEEYDRMGPSPEERPSRERERAQPAPAEAPAPQAAQPVSEAVTSAPADEAARGAEYDRDQRGRRSRRRRARGRGFPDSKYAQQAGGTGLRWLRTEEAAPASGEAVSSAEQEPPSEDFQMLPGESLAKYSRSEEVVAPAEDAGPLEPIETVEEVEDEEAAGPVSEEAARPVAAEEPAAVEEVQEVEPLAVEEVAAEEPLPAEPAVEQATAGEGGDVFTEEVLEAVEEQGGEASEVAEAPVETEGEAGNGAEAETGSAAVREPGARYMHRMSRRMRRKMRGAAPDVRPTRAESSPEAVPPPRPQPAEAASKTEKTSQPSISDLLKERQEILVQIAKEPLGQKGARITSHIALPGRYVVFMPTLEHMGVSRKIASDEERARLRRILQTHKEGISGGFIVRTAGEGRSEAEIAADMNFLFNLWMDIRQKAEKRSAPALIYHDVTLVQRILRDQLADGFKTIWVDNEDMYEDVLRFLERFQPALVSRVRMWTRQIPIFDAFNITSELEKALRPKVWLKSGGYIVINQTEALVAIDVNTGKFVGKSNRLEDTIVKINTEAVKEIVRQMRLRDLGGIIVVDFIDMDERKNRQKVMQALEEAMRNDRAPYKILQFNDFGLVAITRKRVKQSLERTLCAPCPYCEGAGYVKSPQTIIGEILQEAHRISGEDAGKELVLRVHPDVAKVLKSTANTYLEELEEILKRSVLVTGDPLLHQEKFDLA
ncbi:MAG: Rne/Rng family ribonuclease [Acidobacteria bacterium]|nr:Rne/Rng family ribonuclease [Acidobacteriota bacterium]